MCLHRLRVDPDEPSAGAAVRLLLRRRLVGRATELHHVLPVQHFMRWVRSSENLVGVCAGCHDEHERAHRRIPRAALPAATAAFCLAAGDAEAAYFDRVYPAAYGAAPNPNRGGEDG
jgi:hypothetical protein